MNSTNKKSPAARSTLQPFHRQAGPAPQFKPTVAELRTVVTGKSVKRPVAPPVYRPQQTPRVLQTKSSLAQHSQLVQTRRQPIAPPVYRPQQIPKVLQTKSAMPPHPHSGQAPSRLVPPPAYRPEAKKIVQPQAHPQLRKAPPPTDPSVWRSKQENPQAPIRRVTAGAAQLHPPTRPGLVPRRPNLPLPRSRQSSRGLPSNVRVIQRMETSHSSSSDQIPSLSISGNSESGPVKTSGGTWVAKEYYAKMGQIDLSARGLHILLEFTPEHPADATKIVLVQTVLAFKNDAYYYVDESVRNRSELGVSIDQNGQSVSPVYAADPKKSASTLGGSALEKSAGGNGYRYRNSFGGIWKVAPAWLQDNPQLRGVESFSQQIFETTAIAVEGNDEGAYYGSVRWGWTWKLGGTLQLIPLSVVSYGSASQLFEASAEKWNVTRTIEGKTPLQLPEVRSRYSTPAPKPPPGLDPQTNNRFAPHDDL